jgi:hypothetical protein
VDGEGHVEEKPSATIPNSPSHYTYDERRLGSCLKTPVNELSPKARGKRIAKAVHFRRHLRTDESDPHASGRFYFADAVPTVLMKQLPVGVEVEVDDVTLVVDLDYAGDEDEAGSWETVES